MFAGEIGAIVAYTLIPVVVIRATNVIKSEQGKKKTQILRGLAMCLHPWERQLKLSLLPK